MNNKMKQIERIMQGFERNIEDIRKDEEMFCQLPVGLICEAFPQGKWSKRVLGGFEFTLPMNYAYIQLIKDFMKDQFPFWKLERENLFQWDRSKSAGYFLYYKTGSRLDDDVVEFEFALRTEEEGTTCVMNQVGTKTVPIYEVVCGEQAKDWTA